MKTTELQTNPLGTAEEFERNARQAVREAVRDHKRAGNPIVGMEDGKIVIVPPEEIQVPDEE